METLGRKLRRGSTVELAGGFEHGWLWRLIVLLAVGVVAGLTDAAAASLMLSWSDNSDNESGFKIERASGTDGAFSAVGTVASNITDYLDEGLAAATTYRYRVCAFNAYGDSAFSNEATATTSADEVVRIVDSPEGGTVVAGQSYVFSVSVEAAEGAAYQWYYNDVAIVGATGSVLTLETTNVADCGVYQVVITVAGVSVASEPVLLTVRRDTPATAWLVNLSSRNWCGSGAVATYVGFVVEGDGAKQVLVRGVGPRLSDFGVSGTMDDPQLVLRSATTGVLSENDNWSDSDEAGAIAEVSAEIGAFGLTTGSADAAILASVGNGAYSAANTDASGGSGTAMVEIYDAGEFAGSTHLVNLSSRAYVGEGDQIMIAGFVIAGTGSKRILLRAVGPTLASFGLTGVLEDPRITVFQHIDGTTDDEIIGENDDWTDVGGGLEVAAVSADAYAFALSADSHDSAIVTVLEPGVYTVHVSGASGGTGVALVEIYDVD